METFNGLYCDGHSSRAVAVVVRLHPDGQLELEGPDRKQSQPLETLRLEQPPGQARALLHWPDGALVEVEDNGRLLCLFANRPRTAHERLLDWARSHRGNFIATMLLTGASISLILVTGLPLLGQLVSFATPPQLARRLGESMLTKLDEGPMKPTSLHPIQKRRMWQLLQQLQPFRAGELPLKLELRSSPLVGANAFCLPGGILVVTDELVRLATPNEMLAVLAHEAGHDLHRHPMQMLVRSHALSLLANIVGIQDNPFPGLGATLVGNAYSRQFEYMADHEALKMLRRLNRPPEAFFSILDKMEKHSGNPKLPSFLLTHPSNRERRSQFKGP